MKKGPLPLPSHIDRSHRSFVALVASCALLVLLVASPAVDTASADSVRVTGGKRGVVKLLVRADRGDRCTVTVRRGARRAKRSVRLAGVSRRRVGVRLAGRGRARARIRCKAARRSPTPLPTRPAREPLSPYDTVIVERTSDRVFVYKGEGDRGMRLLYDHTLDLPGWESVVLEADGRYYDHLVQPFSGDFSQALFHGTPSSNSAGRHIGRLDLVTGEVVDLTAPRQGTGFSEAVLCEESAGYVFQTSPTAGSGSDTVVFLAREGTLNGAWCFGDRFTTSVSNPSQVSAAANALDYPWSREDASEDGRYLLGYQPGTGDESGVFGFHAADGSSKVPVDCVPDGEDGRNESLLGWVGPRTVVLGVSGSDDSAYDWRTATLTADGRVECGGGLPPTSKDISEITLGFDGSAVLFAAEGPNGIEQWRQPIAGGDPVRATYDALPEDSTSSEVEIYRVGPAHAGPSNNPNP